MVAGEASADLHGSHLVRAIKSLYPSSVFCGIGGNRMEEAGVKIICPSSDMAVVGLTEAFSRLSTIFKAVSRLKRLLKRGRPDLLILLDYPDFNLHVAGIARRAGVPVLYYISPQIWAWRKGRIRKIARRVDRMAVILPFEETFYRRRGVRVDYVGHPLLDLPLPPCDPQAGRGRDQPPVLALVPGSRREEIRNLLPIILRAAALLKVRYPCMRFLLPLAPTIEADFLDSFIRGSDLEIEVSREGIYSVLAASDAAVVASGTATLETAIMGIPMVIVYRVSPISFRTAKVFVKVDKIGLVNLVAGEEVVPELIQHEVTPGRIAGEVIRILEEEGVKREMVGKLRRVKELLGMGGASEKVARIALELMGV